MIKYETSGYRPGSMFVVGVMAGAAIVATNVLDMHFTPEAVETEAVRGVPMQVEGRWARQVCYPGAFDCSTNYMIKIEQCPADILAARNGSAELQKQVTESSLDTRLGHVAAGCFTTNIKVADELWPRLSEGSIITISGDPTVHLMA
jgi:hypothetical protein